MTLRIVSYGGGVQSTALLVLAAEGAIDFGTFIFADVGHDSEDPRTIAYVREVAAPYADHHGIALHVVRRRWRDGRDHTLYQHITKPSQRGIAIPLRGRSGAPQKRACTADFKVGATDRWLRDHGATPSDKAMVALGISVDEVERATSRERPIEHLCYPLLDLGLTRSNCEAVIRRAGLPVPHPSACWFCPFHSIETWAQMRRDRPDLFAAAAALEGLVLARQRVLGHRPLYLTRLAKPLDQAVAEAPEPLFRLPGEVGCDEGWCMT